MKKVLVMVLAGIMATMMIITGCGSDKKSDKKKDNVDVDVEVIGYSGDDNYCEIVYIFSSDDTHAARKLCEKNIYEHLDNGETVSEMIETSDENGNTIYKFHVIKKVAG